MSKSNDKFLKVLLHIQKKSSCIGNKHVYLVDGSKFHYKTTINPACMCKLEIAYDMTICGMMKVFELQKMMHIIILLFICNLKVMVAKTMYIFYYFYYYIGQIVMKR